MSPFEEGNISTDPQVKQLYQSDIEHRHPFDSTQDKWFHIRASKLDELRIIYSLGNLIRVYVMYSVWELVPTTFCPKTAALTWN